MAFGPATAAILGQLSYEGNIWTVNTSPGWVMFLMWAIYFVSTLVYFEDPESHRSKEKNKIIGEIGGPDNEKTALLKTVEKTDQRLPSLWTNIPVMITLWNYFVLKMVLECLLSSSAEITTFYFHWNLTKSGIFLAILGLLMFPANLVVAGMSRKYEEREMIRSTLYLILLGSVGILCYFNETYSEFQYIFFAICVFFGTNALESPNMSLLSKTIPHAWAKGTFNSGLLATEAGTFARVVGDGLVSFVSFWNHDNKINGLFIPMIVLVVITLILVRIFYSSLDPKDDDDDDDTDEDSLSVFSKVENGST